MNKKGDIILMGLPLHTWVALFIFCFIGGMITVSIYDSRYKSQKEEGNRLLESLELSTEYISPKQGETYGYISAILNGSEINGKVDMAITYVAYNFNRSQNIDITESQKNSSLSLSFPYPLPQERIDTSLIYSQLGHEANVCIVVEVTYKEVNWIAFLGDGYPSKRLEDCKPFLGSFE